jgi:hypothetical protein
MRSVAFSQSFNTSGTDSSCSILGVQSATSWTLPSNIHGYLHRSFSVAQQIDQHALLI